MLWNSTWTKVSWIKGLLCDKQKPKLSQFILLSAPHWISQSDMCLFCLSQKKTPPCYLKQIHKLFHHKWNLSYMWLKFLIWNFPFCYVVLLGSDEIYSSQWCPVGKFHLNIIFWFVCFLLWGWSDTGINYWEGLQSLHPWKHPKPHWSRTSETFYSQPCAVQWYWTRHSPEVPAKLSYSAKGHAC